jgi:hypothetical protein
VARDDHHASASAPATGASTPPGGRRDEPPSISHNDLRAAFEAGYREGWQYNGGEMGYVHGAFEDWLRNWEAERGR